MEVLNKYPIFEPDQVLTSEHLNNLLTYLDQQNRLTRTQLIGMGIVCGLEVSNPTSDSIHLSRGCGVTSEGYLISIEACTLTQFADYTAPFPPRYDLFYEGEEEDSQIPLWEIMPEDAESTDDVPLFPLTEDFLGDKAVLLYLECPEISLKNCIETDCDNKGKELVFTVKKLLIQKADLLNIIQKAEGREGELSEAELAEELFGQYNLPDVSLRRFSVPVSNIDDAENLLTKYESIINVAIPNVASALNASYDVFAPLISDMFGDNNPFADIENGLQTSFDQLLNDNPISIQYFYDFLSDLIQAYDEFRDKAFELVSECCPDTDRFPKHLMLGEALTGEEGLSVYRNYFILAPIYANQTELLAEIRMLYRKLYLLTERLNIPQGSDSIRITPSQLGKSYLSDRAIPFYYAIQPDSGSPLQRFWSYEKSRKGKANRNLSYNADTYSTADTVVEPLNYEIEPYDFFRIEGHIGMSYDDALKNIEAQKRRYRLPFDIVALKLGDDAQDTDIDYSCHFDDLEAIYAQIRSDLFCTLEQVLCEFAKISYDIPERGNVFVAGNFASFLSAGARESAFTTLSEAAVTRLNFRVVARLIGNQYQKGDFLNEVCEVSEDTIGAVYNAIINDPELSNVPFNTAVTNFLNNSEDPRRLVLAYILIIMNEIDEVAGAIQAESCRALDMETFAEEFEQMQELTRVISEFLQSSTLDLISMHRDLINEWVPFFDKLICDCSLDNLNTLKTSYEARTQTVLSQNLFKNFIDKHPGIEHKAGVPKGGTFILVYYREPIEEDDNETGSRVAGNNILATNPERFIQANRFTPTFSVQNTIANIQSLLTQQGLSVNTPALTDLLNAALLTVGEEGVSITDKAVIADFYLPYVCCSDCAPVSYVFPRPLASINLPAQTYCQPFDGENIPQFAVSPSGGTVTGPGVEEREGQYFFNPNADDVAIGEATFTYEVDGETAELTIEVIPAPVAAFSIEELPPPLTHVAVRFEFTNQSQNANRITWDFGDGGDLVEINEGEEGFNSIIREYPGGLPGAPYSVVLTAYQGACSSSQTQVIEPITQEVVFTIKEDVFTFCYADQVPYGVVLNPEGGTIAPEGIIENDANTGLKFIPSNAPVGTHTLTYTTPSGDTATMTLEVIQPDATFTPSLQTVGNNRLVILTANEDRESIHNWAYINPFSGAQTPINSNEKEISITAAIFQEFQTDEITFIHRVTILVNGNECENTFQLLVNINDLSGGNRSFTTEEVIEDLNKDVSDLDVLPRNSFFRFVLTVGDPVYEGSQTLFKSFSNDLQNPITQREYVSGVANDSIAESLDGQTQITADKLFSLGSNIPEEGRNIVIDILLLQVKQLFNLGMIQEREIRNNDSLIKLMRTSILDYFSKMKDSRINPDPNGQMQQFLGQVMAADTQTRLTERAKEILEIIQS